MDRRTFIASAGAASAFALFAGLPIRALAQPGSAPAPASGANGALNGVMDRIFLYFMDNSPEFATALGLDTGARAALRSKLSDYSVASRARDLAAARGFKRDLDAIPRARLTGASPLHYDTVQYMVTRQIEAVARFPYGNNGFGFSPYVLSQQDGAYQGLPDFLDQQHPVHDAADADAYLARLDAFATALDQNSDAQRHDAALGAFAPSFCLDTTLGQLRALRDHPAAETVLVTSLVRKAGEAHLAGDYGARAAAIVSEKVFPALDRQIALVTELRGRATGEAGVWRLPQGGDYYAAAVQAATTTTMSPEEVHQLGLAQVAEISGRIGTILDAQHVPAGEVGARLTALGNDPAQLYPNTDAGRAELLADLNRQLARISALLPGAFATLPRAELRIVRVPEFIQDGAPNGYYNSAPLDHSRPALYYINLKDTHDWPKYGLPTLTHHEGVPGHHLQISLAQESAETPNLLKVSGFGAYVEGWALYAEQLADELGVYEGNPPGQVGFLQSLLFRAARLVVDTGIHHKRWSRAQATDYMVRTTGFPVPRTQREIDRYCVAPGQACSYKVGHVMWERVRANARQALGARFDLKQFHQILLKGALPLTILEQEVGRWVAAQRA
ncbi:MAG TPA: DUF885 family protein [Allosphingosinicella sp.]|nr:DUF885 family protein [Allosphingosinicella sp.]